LPSVDHHGVDQNSTTHVAEEPQQWRFEWVNDDIVDGLDALRLPLRFSPVADDVNARSLVNAAAGFR
jgi:hypothetical protein